MAKALDGEIVVSEFELQLRYYIHFRTNNLGKGILIPPPRYGLNSATNVPLLGHWPNPKSSYTKDSKMVLAKYSAL